MSAEEVDMQVSHIIERLRTHIEAMDVALAGPLEDESHFVEDLGLDSLDLVEFVARFEQEFDLFVPDEDLEGMVSLRATAEYVAAACDAAALPDGERADAWTAS